MPNEMSHSPQRKNEQFVTELTSPNDYWVSVTDAARITRRQEHTIRTWVGQGLLPVHPERTGINKRTRRVRMSDLARLTPIIDQSAAVTSEQGNLDLFSIPRQQQEILEAYQQLFTQLEQVNRQLDQQISGIVRQQERSQETIQREITILEKEQRQALESLHIDLATKIEMLQQLVDLQHRQHEELVTLLNGQNQRITRIREELTKERNALAQEIAVYREENTQQVLLLTQSMDNLQRWVKDRLEEKAHELFQIFEARLDQHVHTMDVVLKAIQKKVAADKAVFTEPSEQ